MLQNSDKVIDESRQGESLLRESAYNKGIARKMYLESYGCQMNFADSEIVASILEKDGFVSTGSSADADIILLNTCAIRDNAEQRIWARLRQFKQDKIDNPDLLIGVMGCMAERLKQKLLEEEKLVDLVVGPDAYRDLPNLIQKAESGQEAVNVLLSREETYSEISPVRLGTNGVSAFFSIMRGCDNMCSFCVVPFTRGRERSRNANSIIAEVKDLSERGFKEVTLLGQNVDSYKFKEEEDGEHTNFAQLLQKVALVDSKIRVRFSTSHPKDITDEVLHTIAKYDNICNYIHLPVQSGSSRMLELMNRTYDREWYMNRVEAIRKIIPNCAISSDVITGFCTETEEDHQQTLSLMDWVEYDYSYTFYYSERPGTLAARKYEDDVPLEIKKRRLAEVIERQGELSLKASRKYLNKTHRVLVEKFSKRSEEHMAGRNDQNKMIVFPKKNTKPGDYVNVYVSDFTAGTLLGEIVE